MHTKRGRVISLDCGATTYIGSLTAGELANGVCSSIPYEGGNGGIYNNQVVESTGVTGLTASLAAGIFLNGRGRVVYTITGTPSAAGTASFTLNIGGQSCTLSLTVAPAWSGTCGAYVASGVWKEFMCHNLGANTSADPLTPSWELNGNYYQWGRNPTCFGRDDSDDFNACSDPVFGASAPWGGATTNDNEGSITGWSIIKAPVGAWMDDIKTVNDPCPTGFRIPTAEQLEGIIDPNLNAMVFLGSWTDGSTNYSSGIQFGSSLFLPAAGYRDYIHGTLSGRGSVGSYYCSTHNSDGVAQHLGFNSYIVFVSDIVTVTHGHSLRCIVE